MLYEIRVIFSDIANPVIFEINAPTEERAMGIARNKVEKLPYRWVSIELI